MESEINEKICVLQMFLSYLFFFCDKRHREKVYCYPDNHIQDEGRYKEVPKFCVNSLVEAEKA